MDQKGYRAAGNGSFANVRNDWQELVLPGRDAAILEV